MFMSAYYSKKHNDHHAFFLSFRNVWCHLWFFFSRQALPVTHSPKRFGLFRPRFHLRRVIWGECFPNKSHTCCTLAHDSPETAACRISLRSAITVVCLWFVLARKSRRSASRGRGLLAGEKSQRLLFPTRHMLSRSQARRFPFRASSS